MKTQIVKILGLHLPDEETARRIIALAVIEDKPRHGVAEKRSDERVAFSKVVEALGTCEDTEVSISPKVTELLCAEVSRRTIAFVSAQTTIAFPH